MDPTATLIAIRAIVRTMETTKSSQHLIELGVDLSELVTALDEWMTKGGFLPFQWKPRR
jgi:hypothetical protein